MEIFYIKMQILFELIIYVLIFISSPVSNYLFPSLEEPTKNQITLFNK